ncbi:ATP-dependent RNA helicase dbp6 [Sorochytrium milnesiophthora]
MRAVRLSLQRAHKKEQFDLYFPTIEEDRPLTHAERQQLKNASLPRWLANPLVVHNEDVPDVSESTELQSLGLRPKLVERCAKAGITSLFAVQRAVIPLLLQPCPPSRLANASARRVTRHAGDLLVSAPTGSGKTLTYVLPIVDALTDRVVTRLRAVVILPTRDLVMQVKDTFLDMVKGTSLTVGYATGGGNRSLRDEQALLIDHPEYLSGAEEGALLRSRIDILVSTPGRLMDHLEHTAGFSLADVQYLVIDEADRLLSESYNNWLDRVLDAVSKRPAEEPRAGLLVHPSAVLYPFAATPRVQKLLFSATLTRNSEKIASLRLHNPLYVAVTADKDVESRYTVPEKLKEYMVVCNTQGDKALQLLDLLFRYRGFFHRSQPKNKQAGEEQETGLARCLCFTRSVEHSRRLHQLIRLYLKQAGPKAGISESEVQEYSSELSQQQKRQVMTKFRNGEIRLVIASDVIARGIDLPNVKTVISYDPPVFIKQYIHRVGRTARAGQSGVAISLVATNEMYHFKEMMGKRGQAVRSYLTQVPRASVQNYETGMETALAELQELYKSSKSAGSRKAVRNGQSKHADADPMDVDAVDGAEQSADGGPADHSD